MKFTAKWFDELSSGEVYEILRVRSQIFIVEMAMHCLDADGVDYAARHFFLEEEGRIVAYLRAFYADEQRREVRIGRVLSVTHGIGLGADVMRRALADIRATMPCERLWLDSQTYASGFYEKLGFRTVSDEFIEAGVPHVQMEWEDLR